VSDGRDRNEETSHDETIDLDTRKGRIAAILYRSNPLTTREITDLLDQTPWEDDYNSIAAALSVLRNNDMASKTNEYGGKWSLTEKGEDTMVNTIREADKYPMTMADKITGKHPTSNLSAD
jgi:chromosome segregation and condensation protein ScpB